ncbi:MAG: hypothetical protein CMM49_08125 [Rhodospirillaceae bacterium]|nr:hypothetical protein [Rhodospirillaceae bacterium]|tara:strand:+ start:803 stop:2500 length:1698 start_codon:yes stop_codon:yes gene_type:complete
MNREIEIFWRKPSEVTREYFDGIFGQLHLRRAGKDLGSKDPIILLHQSPSNSRPFEGLMKELCSDRLVYAIDTPGFGDSDAPVSPPNISDYAFSIIEFINHLNFDTVNLFGDHTGAKIAVEIIKQNPSKIGSAVFNSCPVYSKKQMKKMMLHLEDEKPKDIIPEDGAHFVERWKSLQKWYTNSPLELINRDFIEMQRPLDKGWYGHNAAFAVNHADNLPKINHPLLVLCPNDMLWDATKASSNFLVNGSIMELPNYGMGSLSIDTEMYSNILKKFYDNQIKLNIENLSANIYKPNFNRVNKKIKKIFLNIDGVQVHARVSGSPKYQRKPILCLHMSPFSSRNFENLLLELGKDRLAIAMDIPGFGESDPTEQEPSIDSLSKIVIRSLMQISGENPIDIMGDHTGAVIALHIAAFNKGLVSNLILNGLPCFDKHEREERYKKSNYNQPQTDGSHLIKRWSSVKMLSGSQATGKIIERNFVEALRGGPFAHWGHKAVFSYKLYETLSYINQPTLIFKPRDGLQDRTDKYFSSIKNVTVRDLPNEDYGFLEYKAKEFTSEIISFLEKN